MTNTSVVYQWWWSRSIIILMERAELYINLKIMQTVYSKKKIGMHIAYLTLNFDEFENIATLSYQTFSC